MELTEYERQNIECALLFILFTSTLDQKEMLKGTLQRNTKRIFNRWYKEGFLTMNEIEKTFAKEMIILIDDYSEKIHDLLNIIRKELENKVLIEE